MLTEIVAVAAQPPVTDATV
jgi:hypothetical protein